MVSLSCALILVHLLLLIRCLSGMAFIDLGLSIDLGDTMDLGVHERSDASAGADSSSDESDDSSDSSSGDEGERSRRCKRVRMLTLTVMRLRGGCDYEP
mmetsp:Transcript_24134/g.54177  ORF Transcript_24134/g.54177 Transcript_24134/m.54177 type:complete len:99 (+) Transcript_24134:124-420(+)